VTLARIEHQLHLAVLLLQPAEEENREVELVLYPREGHEVTRSGEPAHRVDHMFRIVEWFERHLRPEASPTRSATAQ